MNRLANIALIMQIIITDVRSTYPVIVDFLRQNPIAQNNIITVWINQVRIKQVYYGVSFASTGSLYDILEPAKMNDLFAFLLLAVIDPEFIDKNLAELIQNQGNLTASMQITKNHSEFLMKHCKLIESMISGYFLDIPKVIEFFSSVTTSETRRFIVRYILRQWSMAFGQIVHSGEPEFEEVNIEQESSVAIFDTFSTIWRAFFQNFERTFAVSFLPFGNISWSEEKYTRLFTTKMSLIISHVIGYFAFQIGVNDDHAFFKSRTPEYLHSAITSFSYGMYIFPDGIRKCNNISQQLCSCFIRDFWHAHRKPDPNMSDIDYIRWLFSIDGNFKDFGKNWIDLMDALQNGTKLPRIQGGSSSNYTYLSFLKVPTDAEVQESYDKTFRQQLGRDPIISDYFEGGTAVPPLPPHAGGSARPP